MNALVVDDEFLDLMHILLAAGRNFSKNMKTDARFGFIIDEAAARAMGWTGPIGKRIGGSDTTRGKVIGEAKDVNYTSLHNPIEPLVILPEPEDNGYLMARMTSGNSEATWAHVERNWQRLAPAHPLDYFFLDNCFNKQYRAEENCLPSMATLLCSPLSSPAWSYLV